MVSDAQMGALESRLRLVRDHLASGKAGEDEVRALLDMTDALLAEADGSEHQHRLEVTRELIANVLETVSKQARLRRVVSTFERISHA